MTPVCAYVRCSTTEHQTLDHQVDSIRDYCKMHKLKLGRIYSDEGESGAKDDREQLIEMMAAVKAGKYERVVVWSLDRLSRRVRKLLQLVDEIGEHSELVSLKQQLDTSTPVGRMVLCVLAAIAEMERDMLIERTRSGIASARKRNGGKWGRKPVPFDTALALKLRSEGESLRCISKLVGVSVGKLHAYFKSLGLVTA